MRVFRKARGVGYVIAPMLIKIAREVGLVGYDQAMTAWENGSTFSEKVVKKSDIEPVFLAPLLQIDYDGPALSYHKGHVVIGIKQTVKNIEVMLRQKER